MKNDSDFEIDIESEVDRHFDDSSLSSGASPHIVILLGGVGVGKTAIRKQRYSTGHVIVDAAEIFLSLSRGGLFDFPGPFAQILEVIGGLIARRAITERRHIVTELIGSEFEQTDALLKAMRAVGYHINLHGITCDIEAARKRNLFRGDDNISAYYAEHYQRTWLHGAAVTALGSM
jgi:hypothetical protein